jgi:hypothetical protein
MTDLPDWSRYKPYSLQRLAVVEPPAVSPITVQGKHRATIPVEQPKRRAPLSSDALFWLAPPRSAFKQILIDVAAVSAAVVLVVVTSVSVTAAAFILFFMKF